MCRKNIAIITHSNINRKRHLNKSRLHLNYAGDSVSSNNVIRMKKQWLDNANNTIIGYLNINSFRSKVVFVEDFIKRFDLFLVSESKLDHTFPSNQFRINGYKIFRLDRNCFGGGLIQYINENIPCNHYKNTHIFQILNLLQLNFNKIIKSGFS